MAEKHEYEVLFKNQLNKYLKIHLDKHNSTLKEFSYSIDTSSGYISKIANHKSRQLPRMLYFFHMCEALNVHPKDFFNDSEEHPEIIAQIVDKLYGLDIGQLTYLQQMINDISKINKNQGNKINHKTNSK